MLQLVLRAIQGSYYLTKITNKAAAESSTRLFTVCITEDDV